MPDQEKIEPGKFADTAAQKILDLTEKTRAVRKIRNSQILTAIFGTIGFAMFISGMNQLLTSIPPLMSLVFGTVLMIIAGVFIQKLTK